MSDTKLLAHHLMKWVLEREEMDYEVLSLNNLVSDTARKNDKRNAYMKFVCPDSWISNVSGDTKLVDAYLAIRVPRELLDSWMNARIDAASGPSAEQPDGLSPVDSPSAAVKDSADQPL